jgi:death-on-curing protein
MRSTNTDGDKTFNANVVPPHSNSRFMAAAIRYDKITFCDVEQLHDNIIGKDGYRGFANKGNLKYTLDTLPDVGNKASTIEEALIKKSAYLIYGIAGYQHPFNDGNKRTAYVVAKTFLNVNCWSITAEVEDIKVTFLAIAAKKMTIKDVEKWVQRHLNMLREG